MLPQLQTIECTYKVLSNFDDATYLFTYGKYCARLLSHCFNDANRIPDWELTNDEVLYSHKLLMTNDPGNTI